MRSTRIFAALIAPVAILIWLARTKPEEILRDVIGGRPPQSLVLLDTGWGEGGGENILTFVHFRIAPEDLDPLLQKGRFWIDAERGGFDLKGRMNWWKPPVWWDPTRLAGPVVRYMGPSLHDDVPWEMFLFVDRMRSEVYGVREEWWR